MGGKLRGLALSLRCEVVIFADFMKIRELQGVKPEIKLDLSMQLKDSQTLVDLSKSARHPRQEVEGHISFANFCVLSRALALETKLETAEEVVDPPSDELKKEAMVHIHAARELLDAYPSTKVLETEVDAVEKMLRGSTFYTAVSAGEMRAVYQAMMAEFSGTGHWYTCENGHPFTVGECGMPMEQARCPECGSPVGGQHHAPAQGVRHAEDIENLAREVETMGL